MDIRKLREILYPGLAKDGRAKLANRMGVKSITIRKWESGAPIPKWHRGKLAELEAEAEEVTDGGL